jgi:hypothetical protein
MTSECFAQRERLTKELLAALKTRLPELEALLAKYSDHWHYEDRIYRFYHGSFKIFALQDSTVEIIEILRSLLPERELNRSFLAIVEEGTGRTFSLEDNARWLEATRPMVEAFFHARFFLEMAVRYGRQLERPPESLPSGWAALLYLYDLR